MGKSRVAAVCALAVGVWTSSGCSEPKQIVPVGPPGIEFRPPLQIPEGQGAQAIGEQSPQVLANADDLKPKYTYNTPPTKPGEEKATASGLKYSTVKAGDGAEAVSGKTVSVHYTGTLANGSKFDSSRDRGTPYEFRLGMGSVIRGWDEGIAGMKVGEQRKLIIPPDIAYGAQGQAPSIPPNATLLFDVELVGVK